jgi:Arc/MetJ-type ribon-helix-helix transcriptional regulator
MPTITLSQEQEQFLLSQVDAGRFPTIDAAVEAAVDRLRYDDYLQQSVQEGLNDLETGQYSDFDDESLDAYFKSLIASASGREPSLEVVR